MSASPTPSALDAATEAGLREKLAAWQSAYNLARMSGSPYDVGASEAAWTSYQGAMMWNAPALLAELDSLREAAGSGGAEAADAARRDAAEHIRDVGSLSTETKTAADAYAHAADLVESLIGLPSPVSPASQVRR